MMTSIAGGLNTGIWLCAVVLGATGSAIIVTVAASWTKSTGKSGQDPLMGK